MTSISEQDAIKIAKKHVPDLDERRYRISSETPRKVRSFYYQQPKNCWFVTYSQYKEPTIGLFSSMLMCISKIDGQILFHDSMNDEG